MIGDGSSPDRLVRPPTSFRRWALACAAPALYVVATDLVRRGAGFGRLDREHAAGYVASVFASLLAWATFVVSISATRGRFRAIVAGAFTVLYAASQGVEGAFFSIYRTYLSIDSLIDSRSVPPALLGELPLWRPSVPFHLLAGAIAASVLVRHAWRLRAPFRVTPVLAYAGPVVGVAMLFAMPASYRYPQSTTPDFIYFNGQASNIGQHLRFALGQPPRLVRVARRDPAALPHLEPKPPVHRNVLLVLEESQRADVTCTAPVADCKLATPATNRAAPGRLPLLEMRSAGSSTAVAIATIWSGLSPTAKGSDFVTAPLLWDYANAAGFDTAYWTSQDLMFGNSRLFVEDLPVSHWVSGTELDPSADILVGATDASLTDRVLDEWNQLREPFFAVVHYSNIHKPRLIDPKNAPFQPTETHERRGAAEAQVNFYKNAVYLSDLAVARLVDAVHASAAGPRTVIVFLSDHGESYFEHNQDNNHSGSVYDEEIHVPAWIDAPEGMLSPSEIASLYAAEEAPTFEIDVAPTILDLFGVRADPALAPFVAKMPGRSLVSGDLPEVTVPLTNVCWAWEYAVPNWGVMRGHRKIEARVRDREYHCFDVASDPLERRDLGEHACADLVDAAGDLFHMMPKDLGRLATNPRWGNGP